MGARQLTPQLCSLFKQGTKVNRSGVIGTIAYASTRECLIVYEDGTETDLVPMDVLASELYNTLHFVQQNRPTNKIPQTLTTMQKAEVARRENYIKDLRNLTAGNDGVGGKAIREQSILYTQARINDNSPPSPATLARWVHKNNTLSGGAANDLFFKLRKPHASRYEYLKPLALAVLDDHFFFTAKPTIKSAYDVFKVKVNAIYPHRSACPSYPTFVQWVKDICWIKDSEMREGKRVTRQAMRNVISQFVTQRPLQRVEVDGVRLAIGLVDDEGNYLGTPTLVIAIDCYTRCILGYYMHIGKGEPASAYVSAYRHAMLPKGPGSYSDKCQHDWPCYGVWESAVTDGGTGAMSEASYAFLQSMGISQSVVQVAAGWKKPFIERFNGTLRTNFAQNIKSYCGHDMSAIQDASIRQKAHLTPAAFKALLDEWIVDDYHQSPHTGLLKNTPYNKWQDSLTKEAFAPVFPAEASVIQLPQGEFTMRTISGDYCCKGIQINLVHYNDAEGKLKEIGMALKRNGHKPVVTCHYSLSDISAITVIDPETENPIRIPTIHHDITEGMSLAEYKSKHPSVNLDRPRTFVQSQSLKDANDAHDKHLKQRKPKRQLTANTASMTQHVLDKKQDMQEGLEKKLDNTHQPDASPPQDKAKTQKEKQKGKRKGFKHD